MLHTFRHSCQGALTHERESRKYSMKADNDITTAKISSLLFLNCRENGHLVKIACMTGLMMMS